MDKIASLIKMLAPLDGLNATNLPGTAIYKEIQHRAGTLSCTTRG